MNIVRLKSLLPLGALILLAVSVLGCKHVAQTPPPPPNPDWTITVAFTYDYTNFPKCSGTVTKGCVSGFTWGYLQSGVPVPIKTSTTTICTGTTQPQSCADTGNATVGIGVVTPYVVANGIDNNGVAVSSAQAIGPNDNVAIAAPAGVTWTRQ